MKKYPITNLQGDKYLNPAPPETRPVGNISKIIIHHDAVNRPHDYDSAARYRNEAASHYATLGPGLQYHFKIDNTGEIFWIRPFTATLWHAANLDVNRHAIAICLDGYFHAPQNQQPTREQLEALQQLLDWLCTQHPEFPAIHSDVFGHKEVSLEGTVCPGDLMFPYVVQYRNTANIAIPASIGYDWPSMQPSGPAPAPAPAAPAPAPTPPTVTISYRVIKDGKQIGAYTVDANAWNKYKAEGGIIVDSTGKDVTDQLKQKFEPVVPPAPIPPVTQQTEEILQGIKQNNALLLAIKAIVEWIQNAIKNVFNVK